ncbi:hypothetical protein [Limnobacter sp.]|uniref:hypothetical protein n=1 Tax=Limnobacter sp. TaxID=2003368 RepID=UPI003511C094
MAEDAAEQADNGERTGGRRRRRRGRGGRGAGEGEANSALDTGLDTSVNTTDQTEQAGALALSEQSDDQNVDQSIENEALANKIAESMSYGQDEEGSSDEPRRRRRRRRGGNRDGARNEQTAGSEGLNEGLSDGSATGELVDANESSSVAELSATELEAKPSSPANAEEDGGKQPEAQPVNAGEDAATQPAEVQQAASVEPDGASEDANSNSGPGAPAEADTEPQVEIKTEPQAEPVQPVQTAPSKTAEFSREALNSMVQEAGMLWVETDREKWTVVQNALAATPAPVRATRVRKPVVMVDASNLVLVETKPEFKSAQGS